MENSSLRIRCVYVKQFGGVLRESNKSKAGFDNKRNRLGRDQKAVEMRRQHVPLRGSTKGRSVCPPILVSRRPPRAIFIQSGSHRTCQLVNKTIYQKPDCPSGRGRDATRADVCEGLDALDLRTTLL